jgi:hypothetical protein
MAFVWIIPAVAALVGLMIAAGLAHRAAEETAGLRRDLDRFAELRTALAELQPALVQVRTSAAESVAAARQLRR